MADTKDKAPETKPAATKAAPVPAFQIDPNWVHTGNMLLDGALKGIVKNANKADLNKNKIPDVAEYAAFVFKMLPVLAILNDCVDFKGLGVWLSSMPFIKNRELFKMAVVHLGELAEMSGELLPHVVEQAPKDLI